MKLLLIFSLFGFFEATYSQELNCFPESRLRFPVKKNKFQKSFQTLSPGGMNELSYNLVIDQFMSYWGPIVEKKMNKKLILKREWNEARVNAFATRDDDNNPVIVINGGMARHPEMNDEALLLILCHELGHHLGGAPKMFRGRSKRRSWSSAEGQADYFATSKCLPQMIQEVPKIFMNSTLTKSEYCHNDLCEKIIPAAMRVGNLFASLKNDWKYPSLDKHDNTVVTRTYYQHATPQCRLDTFISGSLCVDEVNNDFDNSDHRIGACTLENNQEAARPACWFNFRNY